MIACLVPRDDAGRVWDAVAPHLAKALDRAGDYSIDDARALVADGVWLLWIAARPGELVAAAVTEINEYPRRRVLYVHAAGGSEGEGIAAMWPKVQVYARDAGCAEVRFQGRRGWIRSKFIPPAWRHVADVVSVEIV
jgi:hypothetical protein